MLVKRIGPQQGFDTILHSLPHSHSPPHHHSALSHFRLSAVWLFCSALTPYLLTLTEQKIHNPSALCQTDNPNTSLCARVYIYVGLCVCVCGHASLCSPPCVLCLRGGRGDKGETKAQRRFEERKVMGLRGGYRSS